MSVAKLGSAVLGKMSLSAEVVGDGSAVLGLAILGEMQLNQVAEPEEAVAIPMMEYLPQYWHDIVEMQEILKTVGIEFDSLNEVAKNILKDAYISTASEKRIAEWEKWLNLPPTGTLEERRLRILRYFGVITKLNQTSIRVLVAQLLNNARSFVKLDDSEIKITVVPLPENQMDELDFDQLYKEIEVRKPCHLGASIERSFSTWGDVRDGRLRSWAEFRNLSSWEEVLMYIPR